MRRIREGDTGVTVGANAGFCAQTGKLALLKQPDGAGKGIGLLHGVNT